MYFARTVAIAQANTTTIASRSQMLQEFEEDTSTLSYTYVVSYLCGVGLYEFGDVYVCMYVCMCVCMYDELASKASTMCYDMFGNF